MDGVNPRFSFTDPVPAVGELGRVHLVAIGGAGMSAVARLLLARGVTVSGSDAADSPTLTALRDSGARVDLGHDAAHVEGVDTVVISSAVREDNVELAAARAAGLRVLHRSQALASLMADTRRVAVAGANGKTTTTSMLVVGLVEAGADPSFASGGEIAQLGTNAALGAGEAFVVEADESDGSFLVYRPHVAVVTNVQPDHLDFYGSLDAVERAYAAFAASVVEGGLLVACSDDPGALALADAALADGRDVVTYGYDEGADLRVTGTVPDGLGTTSVLVHDGTERLLRLEVPGAHNVLDACAAYLAAVVGLGADPDAVLAGLAGFLGARRRFEVRGEVDGVTVVDDYAHNPPKVAAVVGTAAEIVARSGSRPAPRRLPAPPVLAHPRLRAGVRARPGPGRHRRAPRRLRRAGAAGRGDHVGADRRPAHATCRGSAGWSSARARTTRSPPSSPPPGPGDLVLTVGAGDVTRLAPRVLEALAVRAAGGGS